MTDRPKPNPEKILPIGPGYVCVATVDRSGRSNGPAPRLPVVAIAEHSPGQHRACVLDAEGRLVFAPGPVYVEGPTHDATSSSKALQEISQALKTLLSLEQGRANNAAPGSRLGTSSRRVIPGW